MIKKLTLLFIVFLGVILYAIYSSVTAQTCMTREQIRTDSRCLYIVNNKVYQKGSRTAPHFGHSCGTDVTSAIPSTHTSNLATYLAPNYVSDVCPSPRRFTISLPTTRW